MSTYMRIGLYKVPSPLGWWWGVSVATRDFARQITLEVKQQRAKSVLGWVTASLLLFSFSFIKSWILHVFAKTFFCLKDMTQADPQRIFSPPHPPRGGQKTRPNLVLVAILEEGNVQNSAKTAPIALNFFLFVRYDLGRPPENFFTPSPPRGGVKKRPQHSVGVQKKLTLVHFRLNLKILWCNNEYL